jgi:hypothetical protein
MSMRLSICVLLITAMIVPTSGGQAAPDSKHHKSHKRIHKKKTKAPKTDDAVMRYGPNNTSTASSTQDFLDGKTDSLICDPVPMLKRPMTLQRRR